MTNDGASIDYPKSESAGQLYSYRMSQNVVILGTRGLVGSSGISIGLKQVASGMYRCEAINNKENISTNITVTVTGRYTRNKFCPFLDEYFASYFFCTIAEPSSTVYIRFSTNNTEVIATHIGVDASTDRTNLVLAYYSTQVKVHRHTYV